MREGKHTHKLYTIRIRTQETLPYCRSARPPVRERVVSCHAVPGWLPGKFASVCPTVHVQEQHRIHGPTQRIDIIAQDAARQPTAAATAPASGPLGLFAGCWEPGSVP